METSLVPVDDPFELKSRRLKRLLRRALAFFLWPVSRLAGYGLRILMRVMIKSSFEAGERVLAVDYELTLQGAYWVATDRALYTLAADNMWWADSIGVRKYPYAWIESIDEISRGAF